jgi:hypothetical protein
VSINLSLRLSIGTETAWGIIGDRRQSILNHTLVRDAEAADRERIQDYGTK